jgi:redox-sensitive bicupin YhaK (pirin superfamily)
MGRQAVIETRTPILYLHYTLAPGARVAQPVARDFNVFAYPFKGALLVGADGRGIAEGQAALFDRDGDGVVLAAPAHAEAPVEVLLLGGQPLNEPVARYGPFVMNTEEEIHRAFADFRSGRFGAIPAEVR